MFQFGMNDFGRFQVRSVPRWQMVILSVLGIALGVVVALFLAGLMLVVVPMLFVGGLLLRWFLGSAKPVAKTAAYSASASKATRPDTPDLIIDADYREIETDTTNKP